MKRRFKVGLLLKIVIAIVLGLTFSTFLPTPGVRIFVTINSIFSNFLSFSIPLIIVGLVAPGIADLGSGAGKLLGITALVAYISTLFAGFFSYFTCLATFPYLLPGGGVHEVSAAGTAAVEATNPLASITSATIPPFFTIDMPPFMDVVSALVFSFILGLGLAALPGRTFKDALNEFGEVINLLIGKVIVPLLPLYIFGIFLKMGAEGQAVQVMSLFLKVIIIIFVMHIALLLIQYAIAGAIAKRNPLKLLRIMLPAYATALGTQSSAATIPVSLQQTIKMGVHPDLAGFVVPLCATIHLLGQHPENRRLCIGDHVDDTRHIPDHIRIVCRLYLHARHRDGSRSRRPGRSDHGGTRTARIDFGFQRRIAGPDDCTLHHDGQLRHRRQCDGRGSHRRDHGQDLPQYVEKRRCRNT